MCVQLAQFHTNDSALLTIIRCRMLTALHGYIFYVFGRAFYRTKNWTRILFRTNSVFSRRWHVFSYIGIEKERTACPHAWCWYVPHVGTLSVPARGYTKGARTPVNTHQRAKTVRTLINIRPTRQYNNSAITGTNPYYWTLIDPRGERVHLTSVCLNTADHRRSV